MSREEQLRVCKKCINKVFELQRGIICKLTNERADFDGKCESFLEDENAIIPGQKFEHPQQRKIVGKKLVCPVCEHDIFRGRKTLMPSRISFLGDTEQYSHEGTNFICVRCSHILWFYNDSSQ